MRAIFLLHQTVKFIGGEVLASLEKCAQDGVSLPGLLQPDTAKMLQKNCLGFADVLPRDARLIVNALL